MALVPPIPLFTKELEPSQAVFNANAIIQLINLYVTNSSVGPPPTALPVFPVAASQAVSVTGLYYVTTPGITLTLAAPGSISGPVIIKDETGNADPDITIVARIDGMLQVVIHAPYQSISLYPLPLAATWALV